MASPGNGRPAAPRRRVWLLIAALLLLAGWAAWRQIVPGPAPDESLIFGTAEVTDLAFQPGGDLLALVSDGRVTMWSGATRMATSFFAPPPTERAEQVAWSPDGTLVGIVVRDANFSAWRVELWQHAPARLVASRALAIERVDDLAIGPGGAVAVSGAKKTLVWRWRDSSAAEGRQSTGSVAIHGSSIFFDSEGRLCDLYGAVWSPDPTAAPYAYRDTFSDTFSDLAGAWSAAAHPTLPMIAVGTYVGDVHILDLRTAKQTRLRALSGAVTAAAFDPTGASVAVGGGLGPSGDYVGEPEVRIWDIRTGRLARTLSGPHMVEVAQIAYSSDGRRVAALVLDDRESSIAHMKQTYVVRVWELP